MKAFYKCPSFGEKYFLEVFRRAGRIAFIPNKLILLLGRFTRHGISRLIRLRQNHDNNRSKISKHFLNPACIVKETAPSATTYGYRPAGVQWRSRLIKNRLTIILGLVVQAITDSCLFCLFIFNRL